MNSSTETIVPIPYNTKAKSGTPTKTLPNIKKDIFEHIATVVHTLTVGVVIFLIANCFTDQWYTFKLHIIFYSVGWLSLMMESILVVSPDNIFSKRLNNLLRVRYHWMVQVIAVCLCTAGFVVAFMAKEEPEYYMEHFKSWHSFVGLIAMICCIPTVIDGVAALFSVDLKKFIKPGLNKVIHAISGILTFVFGTVALILGLYTDWFKERSTEAAQVACFIIVVFVAGWSLYKPLYTVFTRLKSLILN